MELMTTPPIMVSDIIPLEDATTYLPAEQDRAIEVFGNRARRINAQDLPVILVYTGEEKNQVDMNSSPVIYYRELNVSVELNLDGEEGEDGIDDFATEVEKRLIYVLDDPDAVDPYAPLDLPYVQSVRLSSTITGHLSDGQSEKFGAVLTYTVIYLTEEPEGVVPTDNFEGVDATIDGQGAIKQETITY